MFASLVATGLLAFAALPAAIASPHPRAGALHPRHEALHAAHHLEHAEAHVKRHVTPLEAIFRRDSALSQLQTEVTAFTNWMNSFFASTSASNSAAAIQSVQTELAHHKSVLDAFFAAAANDPSIGGRNLGELQVEAQAFQGWAAAWVQQAPSMTDADARAQLNNEVTAYEGWLSSFLGSTSSDAHVPAAASVDTTSTVTLSSAVSTTTLVTSVWNPTSVFNPTNGNGQPAVPTVTTSTTTATLTPLAQASSSTKRRGPSFSFPPPKGPSASPSPASSSAPAAASPQPANNTPSSSPPSSNQPSSGGSQPSNGKLKLSAWWGQTAAASQEDLSSVCGDPSFDIVILAFLNKFFEPNGYPTLNLGPATGSPSAAQTAAGATGLFDGSQIVPALKKCQSNGKKVFLSLGGAYASGSAHSGSGPPTSVFDSDDQGTKFAGTLWDLFLGGDSPLRPFGSLKLDGIDVDSEAGVTTGYAAFAKGLRAKYATDSSKQYYISGAPQCPMPDQSIPVDAMNEMDYVWVQFYNNGACNHGQGASFFDSVSKWSQNLAGGKAQLFVAAIASTNQGSGFIGATDLAAEVAKVKALGLSNFGGYALWDSSLAMQTSMQSAVKQALG